MSAFPATTLPTELIHRIVALVITQHLDDVIAGPLHFPAIDEDPAMAAVFEEDEYRLEIEDVENFDDEDPALDAPNPVTTLLSTSFLLRELTFKSLSVILGIALRTAGDGNRYVDVTLSECGMNSSSTSLACAPWDHRIQPVRVAFSNSALIGPSIQRRVKGATDACLLLRCYHALALTSKAVTTPIPLDAISLNVHSVPVVTALKHISDTYMRGGSRAQLQYLRDITPRIIQSNALYTSKHVKP